MRRQAGMRSYERSRTHACVPGTQPGLLQVRCHVGYAQATGMCSKKHLHSCTCAYSCDTQPDLQQVRCQVGHTLLRCRHKPVVMRTLGHAYCQQPRTQRLPLRGGSARLTCVCEQQFMHTGSCVPQ